MLNAGLQQFSGLVSTTPDRVLLIFEAHFWAQLGSYVLRAAVNCSFSNGATGWGTRNRQCRDTSMKVHKDVGRVI